MSANEEQASAYALTGMPNAGKTTAANMLSKVGFQVYEVGDTVRYLGRNSDFDVSERGSFVEEFKSEHGPAAFTEETVNMYRINPNPDNPSVISGIRQEEEREFLEDHFVGDVETVAVTAGKENRRNRYLKRGKEEDIKGQEFEDRDDREFDQGVAELIAKSDRYLNNDGSFKDLGKTLTETLDFNPHLYRIKKIGDQTGQSVYAIHFEDPDHAKQYSENSNLGFDMWRDPMLSLDPNSRDEIETDIQNFYTDMMTEAAR